jgi:hypothetical protein
MGVVAHPLEIEAWIGTPSQTKAGAPSGLGWLIAELGGEHSRYFVLDAGPSKLFFQLKLAGWEKYSALKQLRTESRLAFMAMKFGDGELNSVVENCFKRAVARTGFELRILTDHQRAGLIDDQIRSALISARFVVADLTHGSFGAYWEAGFADGRGLPVIYTCRQTEWERTKTHFDTNHMTTVIWNAADLTRSENEMASIIRATLRAEAKQTDD